MTTPLTSYSEFGEDMHLLAFFHNIDNGFYVDVGAYDPERLSDTKLLYDRGWHGINIEPVKSQFDRIKAARPRDININTAVSDHDGTMTMFVRGARSTLNAKYKTVDRKSYVVTVPVTTIARIVNSHIPPNQPVHLCKIDIEGHELEAINGIDFTKFRPWMFIIESQWPDKKLKAPSYGGWEHILLENGYVFAEQIDINRVYVDKRHLRLIKDKAPVAESRKFVGNTMTLEALNDKRNREAPSAGPVKTPANPVRIPEKKQTRRIPIALTTDANTVLPMSVTIASLCKSAEPGTLYDVHIFISESITQMVSSMFLPLKKIFTQCAIHVHAVDETPLSGAVVTGRFGIAALYRLLLPTLLSQLDKCIYIDTDILVMKDLSALYSIDLGSDYIAAVRSAGLLNKKEKEAERVKLINIPDTVQYINSGVLLMNLKQMRADGIQKKFLEQTPKGFPLPDQDIINMICYGRVKIIPFEYNVMVKLLASSETEFFKQRGCKLSYTRDEYRRAVESPTIIHFASRKPWNAKGINSSALWWQYAARSPFWPDIKAAYSKFVPAALKSANPSMTDDADHPASKPADHAEAAIQKLSLPRRASPQPQPARRRPYRIVRPSPR